ncbi:hypothetical protein GCM10027443_15710 [Pontibacter brevis]
MKNNSKQYKDSHTQPDASGTYIRNGWIPTVVYVPNRETRKWDAAHQPKPYPRSCSRNTKRQHNWVAWPQI